MEGHSREVDVAIIGGGPAGLSLAVGLRTALPSLKVAVFERGAALKPKGAAVTLPGNALRALNALGAFQACFADPSTTPLTGVRFLDENDQETSFVSFPEPTDPMQRPMAMTWFKLQCVLLSLLPKHMIHYGTEFQELQQTAEQVVVKFKNGVSVTARIVVGADGNLSAVRAHILDEVRWKLALILQVCERSCSTSSTPGVRAGFCQYQYTCTHTHNYTYLCLTKSADFISE